MAEPAPAESIKTVAGWGMLRNLGATTDSGRPVLRGTLKEGSAESYDTVVKFEESVPIEFTSDLSAAEVTTSPTTRPDPGPRQVLDYTRGVEEIRMARPGAASRRAAISFAMSPTPGTTGSSSATG